MTPIYVLLQEEFDADPGFKMAYRAQSNSFNYIFNLGREMKRRQPIKQVGIVVCKDEIDPFFCTPEDLHLVFLNTAPDAEVEPGIDPITKTQRWEPAKRDSYEDY